MDLSAGSMEALGKQNRRFEANKPLEMQAKQQEAIISTRVGNKENQQVEDLEPSSQDTNQQENFCFACQKSLSKSRHLINVAGQSHRWHPECFQCSVCMDPMDRQSSCHLYKGKIICRQDYAKLQRDHSAKCARCRWPIGPADWVRKAASHIYHLACFTCDICQRQLSTGEQFTVRQASLTLPSSSFSQQQVKLLCRLHFAISEPPQLLHSNSPSLSSGAQQLYNNHHLQHHHQPCHLNLLAAETALSASSNFTTIHDYHHLPPSITSSGGSEQHNRHSMDVYEEASLSAVAEIGEPVAGTSAGSSNGSTSGGGGQLLTSSKSKRVRTTFTEDQLSILQNQFQVDSNPDGQDLERIATITGLSKRVTQVWFQNSRARQKKYMIKRKPVSCQQPANLSANSSLQDFNHHHQQQATRTQIGNNSNRLCNWSVGASSGSEQHLEAMEVGQNLGEDGEEDEDEDGEEDEEDEELQSDVDQLLAPSSSNCGAEDSN